MRSSRPAAAVVLAAGEGTRMRSSTPKVLHAIGGRSLLGHALAAVRALDPEHLVVVVRHERDRVAAHVAEVDPHAVVADQDERPRHGPRRAVRAGRAGPARRRRRAAVAAPWSSPTATCRCSTGAHPRRAGRRARGGRARRHRPHRRRRRPDRLRPRAARRATAASPASSSTRTPTTAQRAISEINSGIYAFDGAVLRDALARVGRDNAQGEMYLTDVLRLARAGGRHAWPRHRIDDVWQTEGVNDRVQLARMGAELNRRLRRGLDARRRHRRRPGHHLGRRRRRAGAATSRCCPASSCAAPPPSPRAPTSGPTRTLTRLRGRARARRWCAPTATARGSARAPPSARSATCARAPCWAPKGKIGGFVETKNAVIGDGSKVPHLSYVGDADDRRGHEHRRGHGLRQLRRRRQAPHDGRRPRPHRQSDNDARRAGDGRRRRLHRLPAR